MSTEKKPYQAPKIFEVELNQDQAILTLCETGTTSTANNKSSGGCNGACKKSMTTGGSAAHPS